MLLVVMPNKGCLPIVYDARMGTSTVALVQAAESAASRIQEDVRDSAQRRLDRLETSGSVVPRRARRKPIAFLKDYESLQSKKQDIDNVIITCNASSLSHGDRNAKRLMRKAHAFRIKWTSRNPLRRLVANYRFTYN